MENANASEHETDSLPIEKRESIDDDISREALGGHSIADLPKNYYRSLRFIASFFVSPEPDLFILHL
jgi:hypothetical protein